MCAHQCEKGVHVHATGWKRCVCVCVFRALSALSPTTKLKVLFLVVHFLNDCGCQLYCAHVCLPANGLLPAPALMLHVHNNQRKQFTVTQHTYVCVYVCICIHLCG